MFRESTVSLSGVCARALLIRFLGAGREKRRLAEGSRINDPSYVSGSDLPLHKLREERERRSGRRVGFGGCTQRINHAELFDLMIKQSGRFHGAGSEKSRSGNKFDGARAMNYTRALDQWPSRRPIVDCFIAGPSVRRPFSLSALPLFSALSLRLFALPVKMFVPWNERERGGVLFHSLAA